jgi:class 3 adenylate cyclase
MPLSRRADVTGRRDDVALRKGFSVDSYPPPAETVLLIAVSDLTAFTRSVAAMGDAVRLFRLMDEYAEFVGDLVAASGGTVVKFIGDAVLMTWPAEQADAAVRALFRLRDEGDAWWAARGLPACRHGIKAHVGSVARGHLGVRGDKRPDVLGEAVNGCFLLKGHGLVVSPQAFRALGPEMRRLLKKHTPPVTYIPVDEPHRD